MTNTSNMNNWILMDSTTRKVVTWGDLKKVMPQQVFQEWNWMETGVHKAFQVVLIETTTLTPPNGDAATTPGVLHRRSTDEVETKTRQGVEYLAKELAKRGYKVLCDLRRNQEDMRVRAITRTDEHYWTEWAAEVDCPC